MRSTADLAEPTKPNKVRIAPSTQSAKLNEATESRIAPRPSIFRIARVLFPFFSASLAILDTCSGPSASFKPSSTVCVPALACTVPTSLASRTRPSVFSTLTASRAARTAIAGSASDVPARLNADQSIASRSERPIQSASRSLIFPARRAAFTAVSPSRAGAAAPTVA